MVNKLKEPNIVLPNEETNWTKEKFKYEKEIQELKDIIKTLEYVNNLNKRG